MKVCAPSHGAGHAPPLFAIRCSLFAFFNSSFQTLYETIKRENSPAIPLFKKEMLKIF